MVLLMGVREDVLFRVRAEYLEMPGLRLSAAQAQRLSGLDSTTSTMVLEVLEQLKFLRRMQDGSFVRACADSPRG